MQGKRRKRAEPVGESRLMSMIASLFFSVPTAFLLWLAVNINLAFWGGFIGTPYLWGTIGVFALLAFAMPTLFPSLLGRIWQGMVNFSRWWGW